VTGTRWLDPSWHAAALDWVDGQLAALGQTRTGEPEQPHVRPWATALRIPTDSGPVWLKASAEGTAYEHGLLQVLADVVPELLWRHQPATRFGSELLTDLRRAEYIAGLGRICSWRRALLTATPEEQVQYADADSGWLAICVDQPPPP
jgi:hypothetical protein